MGRFLLFVGVTAFFAMMLAALVPLAFPDVMQLTAPLLCPGEELVVERSNFSYGTTSGFTQYVICVGSEGQRRTVDTFATIAAMFVVFIPPALVLSLLGTAWLARVVRNNAGRTPQERGLVITRADGPPASDSLSDKLRQLDEAYRAGLITEAEYQRARQEVLDGF